MTSTRQYEFINGPTTSELPAYGTPTGTTDLISLGYADENYMQGGSYKATITTLKAVSAANRKEGDIRYAEDKQWFYKFSASATGSNDDDLILTPSAGSGRWIKVLQNLTSNFAGLTDTQNVTNKTVSGSVLLTDVYFKSSTGTNRKMMVDTSGASNTTKTTLTFVQTADRVITFQDSSHVVVGRDTTDTLSNKTNDSGDFTTYARMKTRAELRFSDADDSNYVGFKAAATIAANKVWTLPNADGSANQVLQTDGSLGLQWATIASATLNQYNTDVGDSSNARTAVNTSLLGDIKASTLSQTFTITLASPGVATCTGHGLSTGDKVYLTTTGALPTGLAVNTTYFIYRIDANSFRLATTLANAAAGTGINTSVSQSGTHTVVSGGLKFTSADAIPGRLDGAVPTTGYVGEYLEAQCSGDTTAAGSYTDVTGCSLTLTQGTWVVGYHATAQVTNGQALNTTLRVGGTSQTGSERVLVAGGNDTCNLSAQKKIIVAAGGATVTLSARSSTGTEVIVQSNATGGIANPDCSTILWAHRIA